MAIASRVEEFMVQHQAKFDVLTHRHSHSSVETARLAGIPGERLAKSVVLEDDDGFVMAVLSSTHHVRLGSLSKVLNRRMRLASEDELPSLFTDCELGAIPALGLAYGMRTVLDDRLAEQPDVYFESGDHEKLIHMSRSEFLALMGHTGHGKFGEQM